jgi:CBS domain-containing protein
MIMSSPVIYITENTPIADALRISELKNIRHLVVRNNALEVKGY